MKDSLKVALAQISPVLLHKERSLDKVSAAIEEAGQNAAELIVFGESLVPGYPMWLQFTDGAAFDNKRNKEIHARYLEHGVSIAHGDLDDICKLARDHKIAVYLGIAEKAMDRGGHSLYCSLVYINQRGEIKSVHRKLQPTYEERLCWGSWRWPWHDCTTLSMRLP